MKIIGKYHLKTFIKFYPPSEIHFEHDVTQFFQLSIFFVAFMRNPRKIKLIERILIEKYPDLL